MVNRQSKPDRQSRNEAERWTGGWAERVSLSALVVTVGVGMDHGGGRGEIQALGQGHFLVPSTSVHGKPGRIRRKVDGWRANASG